MAEHPGGQQKCLTRLAVSTTPARPENARYVAKIRLAVLSRAAERGVLRLDRESNKGCYVNSEVCFAVRRSETACSSASINSSRLTLVLRKFRRTLKVFDGATHL